MIFRAGSFRWNAGRWELHNDGAVSALDVHVDGGFTARISAGSDALVLPSDASGSVEVLTAPPRSLDFTTPAASALSTQGESGDLINEAATVGLRDLIGLTEPEIRMLVALCEPRLRNPREQSFVVPTTAEICDRLDVSPKRVEDLVDSLSVKLSRHVGGTIGSNEGRAVTRRHRIAAFAIDTRCITVADLKLLQPGR